MKPDDLDLTKLREPVPIIKIFPPLGCNLRIYKIRPEKIAQIQRDLINCEGNLDRIFSLIFVLTLKDYVSAIEPKINSSSEQNGGLEMIRSIKTIIYSTILEINPGLDINEIAVREDQGLPTGLFDTKLTPTQLAQTLAGMKKQVLGRVIGQDGIVNDLFDLIQNMAINPNFYARPGSPGAGFLFIGPSGVGKTELPKAIAKYVLGSEQEYVLRLDMGEFMESHQMASLIGSPPGYVGGEIEGRLTGWVQKHPRGIVIFDELEKAHWKIWHYLLGILDNGQSMDAQNRVADFRKIAVVATTNIGMSEYAAEVRKGGFGFGKMQSDSADGRLELLETTVRESLGHRFPAELIKRFTLKIFGPLNLEDRRKIVPAIWREKFKEYWDMLGIEVTFTKKAIEYLAEFEYDPKEELGVRDIKFNLDRLVITSIGKLFLAQEIQKGDKVRVGFKNGGLTYDKIA
jgi:ATP-dependent Clp protease ATP-binding subunit ClpC